MRVTPGNQMATVTKLSDSAVSRELHCQDAIIWQWCLLLLHTLVALKAWATANAGHCERVNKSNKPN